MKSGARQDRRIFGRPLDALWRHSPLGAAKRVNTAMGRLLRHVPGCRRLFSWIDKCLYGVHNYLDGSIDRKFGTDTSGRIDLDNLEIASKNTKDGVWYEPMSRKIFCQIMDNINIDCNKYNYVDFGSGKGRVLLLASSYGFKNIIGVEFSEELHQISEKNVALWEVNFKKDSNIITTCQDAAEFILPSGPLVIFFYSPFVGKTMTRVVGNIMKSFEENPREILIIFYGANKETINLLKKTQFRWRELSIYADWSHFNKYRAFIFTAMSCNEAGAIPDATAPGPWDVPRHRDRRVVTDAFCNR